MALTGRTGADAVFQLMNKICHVLTKYNSKFRAVAAAALAAGAIDSAEYALIVGFVDGASLACSALAKLAQYSGF